MLYLSTEHKRTWALEGDIWGVRSWVGRVQCGRDLWSHTCRKRPVWSAASFFLPAHSTDDWWHISSSAALHIEPDNVPERVWREREIDVGQNMWKQSARKESGTSDYDLVTVTAYSNLWTSKPGTLQPKPHFRNCESRRSPDFCLGNFFLKLLRRHHLGLKKWKEIIKSNQITLSTWVHAFQLQLKMSVNWKAPRGTLYTSQIFHNHPHCIQTLQTAHSPHAMV